VKDGTERAAAWISGVWGVLRWFRVPHGHDRFPSRRERSSRASGPRPSSCAI
jgi:hypothetical protein